MGDSGIGISIGSSVRATRWSIADQKAARYQRAEEPACGVSVYGILLHGEEDAAIADYFIRSALPAPQDVELLLGTIRTANVALTIPKLQERVNLAKGKIEKILEFLLLVSPAPIQKTPAGYVLNPVRWQMPVDRIERITNLRRGELERMQVYMGSQHCLMQFLAEELNDPDAGPCGKCVNCAGLLLPEDYPEDLAQAAVEFLDRQENPIQPRKRWPPGLADPEMHGNIVAAQQAQEGRALCR